MTTTPLPTLMASHAFDADVLEQAVHHVAQLVRRAAERDDATEEEVLGHLSDAMLGAAYLGYMHALRDELTGEEIDMAARSAAYRILHDGGCPGLAYRTVLRLWGRPRPRRNPASASG